MNRCLPIMVSVLNVLLVIFPATGVILWGVLAFRAIAFRYPLDYGEAHMLDQAMRLLDGENIYRHDRLSPPYSITNYPPVMVGVMVPLEFTFGPTFWWGRALCVLCTLATALLLGLLTFRFTNDRVSSFFTGAYFCGTPGVAFWSPLVRVDMLALTFSVAGIFTLSRQQLKKWQFVCGIVLLVSAAFTKQSYLLAAPLACFCWLWCNDRKRAWRLVGALGIIGIGAALALDVATDGGFLFHVVRANVHEFTLPRLVNFWGGFIETTGIGLSVGLVFLSFPSSFRAWPLLGPFLVGAALASLTVGKAGSSINYFLELNAALALASGQALAWGRAQGSMLIKAGIVGCIALQSGLNLENMNEWCGPITRNDLIVART